MAAATVQTLYSRDWVALDNGHIARPITVPTNWKRLRVGVLCAFSGAASITTGWSLGFSSGTTNLYGDASTTHWAGAYSSAAWTHSGGAYTSGAINYGKRINTTTTQYGGGLTGYDMSDLGTRDHVSGYFVDLVKGTTTSNWEIQILFNDTAPSGSNSLTTAAFERVMKFGWNMNNSYIKPSGYYYHAGGASATIEEATYGYFNAATFFWGGSAVDLYVDRFTVAAYCA